VEGTGRCRPVLPLPKAGVAGGGPAGVPEALNPPARAPGVIGTGVMEPAALLKAACGVPGDANPNPPGVGGGGPEGVPGTPLRKADGVVGAEIAFLTSDTFVPLSAAGVLGADRPLYSSAW
jgi:hypothetical protein